MKKMKNGKWWRPHPLYSTWIAMRVRCYRENTRQYPDYGGRGVQVCDEWKNNYQAFYKWAMENGWKPGLQIDKDIKAAAVGKEGLLYSPEWCSVVTQMENCAQRRNTAFVTINGETKIVMEWCRIFGMDNATYYSRRRYGLSDVEAFTKPIRKTLTIEEAEEIMSLHKMGVKQCEIAKKFNTHPTNISFIVTGKRFFDGKRISGRSKREKGTPDNNAHSFRITANGETKTLFQWARDTGIGQTTISSRIKKKGWSAEDAVNTPVRKFTRKAS